MTRKGVALSTLISASLWFMIFSAGGWVILCLAAQFVTCPDADKGQQSYQKPANRVDL